MHSSHPSLSGNSHQGKQQGSVHFVPRILPRSVRFALQDHRYPRTQCRCAAPLWHDSWVAYAAWLSWHQCCWSRHSFQKHATCKACFLIHICQTVCHHLATFIQLTTCKIKPQRSFLYATAHMPLLESQDCPRTTQSGEVTFMSALVA